MITGRCHTLYDFSPVEKSNVELWANRQVNDTMRLVKTQNQSYSHCSHRNLFHMKYSGYSQFHHSMKHHGFISVSMNEYNLNY